MRPIKLYFAASWAGKGTGEKNLIDAGVRNKLVSYAYPGQFRQWIKELPKNQKGCILVDSGAFTAWNKGKEINLDEYIEYAHEVQAVVKKQHPQQEIRIVNLDVIPGAVGQTHSLSKNQKAGNLEIIEKAARQGFKNLKIMVKNGIQPIHVFHQGENFKWLDRMLKYCKYIGISPANDMPSRTRSLWIKSVFMYLHKNNIDVDTHGFAVTNRKTLLNFPWTSCDAASWRLSAGMGNIYYPVGGFTNPDFSQNAITMNISKKKTSTLSRNSTPACLELLEKDGYSYEDLQTWQTRTRVNIRFFLALEKWINEQKPDIEFNPQKGFDLF